jgi:hypothetical protein
MTCLWISIQLRVRPIRHQRRGSGVKRGGNASRIDSRHRPGNQVRRRLIYGEQVEQAQRALHRLDASIHGRLGVRHVAPISVPVPVARPGRTIEQQIDGAAVTVA